jgi:hypothetical protein
VQAGPFVPEVSLTRPEALAELHREFVRSDLVSARIGNDEERNDPCERPESGVVE